MGDDYTMRDVRTFAQLAHGDQLYAERFPFVMHLDQVFWTLKKFGCEDTLIHRAAFLHDVVEDTHVQLDEVHDSFGTDMARLVHGVTMPEEMSRLEAVSVVADHMKFDSQIQTLKLADRISNVQLAVWEGNKRIMRFYAREHHIFKRAHTAGQSMDHMWSFLDDMLKPWTKKD